MGNDHGVTPSSSTTDPDPDILLSSLIERIDDVRSASDLLTGLLDAVLSVAAGLNLTETLQRIVAAAANLADARYGALGVLGHNGLIDEFVTVGMSDQQAKDVGNPPRGLGILGTLTNDPQPLRLDDLSAHHDSVGFPEGHPPMSSFVGVPIRVRGRVFGNLYLTNKIEAARFSHQDEQVLVALAAAAGVAIENARLFARTQLREAWLSAAGRVVATVLREESAEHTLSVIVDSAHEAAGSDGSWLALRLGNEWIVERAVGLADRRLVGEPLPTALTQHLATEPTFEPKLHDLLAVDEGDVLHTFSGAITVALRDGSRPNALLVLGCARGRRGFGEDDREPVAQFADQVSLALQLASTRKERQRLVLLEERDRIARDLHDLVIQRLFATGMMLQGAARTSSDPTVTERIDRAVGELDATILEVRSAVYALHASRDEPSGLRSRLLRELAAASDTLGFEPTIRFDGPIDSVVPDEVAEHVVAALREALANTARHAGASLVRISASVDDRDVVLIVTDNGRGISPVAGRRSGLANLEDRAVSCGGSCVVETGFEARGTRLIWRAPVRG